MGNIVEIRNVSMSFDDGDIKVLSNIDLEVKKGEFLAIMGRSGAGKSTLLNIIGTINKATEGNVVIDGKPVQDLSEDETCTLRYKNIGYVFQNFMLQNFMNNRDNIMLPALLNKEKKEDIEKRLKSICQPLGIYELLDKYPTECSGGQRQRVAIARALINNPKLIIADEPTGNLDSHSGSEIVKVLTELNEVKGITIIMVTHDMRIASFCKKILYINDGKIQKEEDRNEMTSIEFYKKIIKDVN